MEKKVNYIPAVRTLRQKKVRKIEGNKRFAKGLAA